MKKLDLNKIIKVQELKDSQANIIYLKFKPGEFTIKDNPFGNPLDNLPVLTCAMDQKLYVGSELRNKTTNLEEAVINFLDKNVKGRKIDLRYKNEIAYHVELAKNKIYDATKRYPGNIILTNPCNKRLIKRYTWYKKDLLVSNYVDPQTIFIIQRDDLVFPAVCVTEGEKYKIEILNEDLIQKIIL